MCKPKLPAAGRRHVVCVPSGGESAGNLRYGGRRRDLRDLMAPLSANYIAYALQSNRDGNQNFLNSLDDDRAIAILKIASSAMKQKAKIFLSFAIA